MWASEAGCEGRTPGKGGVVRRIDRKLSKLGKGKRVGGGGRNGLTKRTKGRRKKRQKIPRFQ